MLRKFLSATALAAGLMIAAAGSASAVTYNLQSGGDAGVLTAGFGNTLTITKSGHTLVVSGYGEDNNDKLVTGQLGRYSPGLGVCNQNEGLNCSPSSHTLDNLGTDDWILFVFDEVATINSVFLSAFGDTDIEWIVGTATFTTLAGYDTSITDAGGLQTLPGVSGLSDGFSFGGSSNRTATINAVGNFILIGAYESNSDDRVKIKNIDVTFNVIPEPATWSLMIASFAGLGLMARRRRTIAA